MRDKRIHPIFVKLREGIRLGPFPNFGGATIAGDARSCKDKKRIVIETFDGAGSSRIRVVFLLAVVDDVAYVVHDDVLRALRLQTITNAYNVDDGTPTLELAAQKPRFDA